MITREQALIRKIREWTDSGLIGDDCAVLPGGGLVSSDALVEGTHFRLDWTDWRRLGWKSCAVNISDVAAMAGRPRHLTVALTLPQGRAGLEGNILEKKLREFYQGFLDCAGRYRARLAGGDLTAGRDIVIAVTVFGESHEKGILLRKGAQIGDYIIATGHFGASAAGLALLSAGYRLDGAGSLSSAASSSASGSASGSTSSSMLSLASSSISGSIFSSILSHLEPCPRLSESWALASLVGNRGALMDASDGLADALCQIAEQSGVAINLDLNNIPLAPATSACAALLGCDPLHWALYGGEDYELVAAIAPADWERGAATLPFTKIGEVVAAKSGAKSAADAGGEGLVRLLEGDRPSERFSGVLDLNNAFKHFC
jgi:thiamine-monophosphate kinase